MITYEYLAGEDEPQQGELYEVIRGDLKPVEHRMRVRGHWDMFEVERPAEAVMEEMERRVPGLRVLQLTPQVFDDVGALRLGITQRHPNDVDAALEYLALGGVLVRLPDFVGSKAHWGFYAVTHPGFRQTRAALSRIGALDEADQVRAVDRQGQPVDELEPNAMLEGVTMYRGARRGDPAVLTGPSYFISSETFAKTYGPTAAFEVDIRRPLVVSNQDWFQFTSDFAPVEDIAADVRASGHDSVLNVRDTPAGKLYVLLLVDPSQARLID